MYSVIPDYYISASFDEEAWKDFLYVEFMSSKHNFAYLTGFYVNILQI
jgi:hypothetical protein